MNYIDIVIPWVDGSDPEWLKRKSKFLLSSGESNYIDSSCERYRDWDILKYWFRCVERNLPWVRKIHFITDGHIPLWLNVEHEKINVVNHRDYMKGSNLPVFSSHPIEVNMHRIKGLSEHFIYFNDDFFPVSPLLESDFFQNGMPCDMAVLNAISGKDRVMMNILVNNIALINSVFDKKNIIKKYKNKWFNLSTYKHSYRNLLLMPWRNFTGFYEHHMPQPFLKSTFSSVWKTFPVELDKVSNSKFRASTDINQYLFRHWQLCSGNFHPYDKMANCKYFQINNDNLGDINKAINEKKIIILNDGPVDDFDSAKMILQSIFNDKFPERSKFEI